MSWLCRAARSLENPRLSLTDPDAWEEAGLLERSTSGARVTPKRALGCPPLWRGINLLANACKKLRPYVYKNQDGAERDKSHPAYPLMRRRVNEWIKAGIFRQLLTYHAVLFGNGYAAIYRDRLGRPVELLPLHPNQTFPFQIDSSVWYGTTIAGERRNIPAADCLHIHGLSFDGLKGLSVIEVMCDALGLALSSRDYAARFFSQGANASGILMIPGHLKEDAVKNAIKDFEKIATGVTRQHKVGVLQDNVKWQPMTKSAQESQLLESRNFDVREVANILGLPPHKLGDGSRTSYNSLEMESQAYLDDSIDPWLVTWEEELEAKLLSDEERDSDSRYIEFNRAALLRTDMRTQTQIFATGRQWGWWNVNTIRKKLNEPSIGPAGEIYLQPTNMTPAGEKPEPKPLPVDSKDPPAPPDENVDPEGKRTARARAACALALKERAERFHKIEVEQVLAAAKRGGNFVGWVETWWEQERIRLAAGLLPELRIAAALDGLHDPDEAAQRLAQQHVQFRVTSLLDVAGRATRDELVSMIETHIAGWTITNLHTLPEVTN